MRATFRPLPAWPYEPKPRRRATYRATYGQTLSMLEYEVEQLRGHEVIIGVVCTPDDIRFDGMLRANARPSYPGVELSLEVPGGRRLVFATDRHRGTAESWQDNVRAIALGLAALRAVDRYGITSEAEQYAGFVAIPADTKVSRGKALIKQHGGFTAALKATRPSRGGDARDFDAVRAYQEASD